jgi:YVTN family beta-propeller protein
VAQSVKNKMKKFLHVLLFLIFTLNLVITLTEFSFSNVAGQVFDIRMRDQPFSIAVNPNTNKVYVTNSGSNTVSVIDGTNNKVITNNVSVGLAVFHSC